MYGWIGKVLRVNLTKCKVSVEDLDLEVAKNFIGGRGLGAKFLFDEIDPKIDPFDSQNKLIFATGPLTSTGAPASNRYMVVTKAPLTGAIANSSCGGSFGSELKFAGYDLIIFEGKSTNPVYLWIENERIEIRDAGKLWGRSTSETEEMIRTETNEYAKIACIGPAGENLVRFANIMDGGRAAGRSGVGAVMGSKNLKAVAVRGTGGVTVADKEGFLKAVREAFQALDSEYTRYFGKYGTPSVLSLVNERGVLPTRNFQAGVFDSAEKLYGEKLVPFLKRKKKPIFGVACFGCPVACGRATEIVRANVINEGHGPEYETIGSLGAACGIDDLKAIIEANYICNEMGFDTITAGMTIACAMELYERGFLPKKDVGMELNFGNAKVMVNLINKIAHREGFGDILAEGSYRLAEKYGHPELSMSTKKQEFPCYDPRGLQGMAIQYATQSRGGDHIRGEEQDIDLYGVYNWRIVKDRNITYVDSFATEDKPLLTKEVQDWFCCIDSSGMCNFMFYLGNTEDNLLSLLETATGVSYGGVKGLMKTGERIFNLERLFNLKAGLTAKDDTLPKRMLETPIPDGPAKGQVARLKETLPKYYELRKWDKNGVPTIEKLRELGLA